MSWTRPSLLKSILICLFLILIIYFVISQFFLYCNDAYVTSDLIEITPEVNGMIKDIPVKDNQFIHKNSLLVSILPTPYQLEVQYKQAVLSDVKQQAFLLNLKQQEANSMLNEANVKFKLSTDLLKRYQILEQDRIKSISAENYERVVSEQLIQAENKNKMEILLMQAKQAILMQQTKIKIAETELAMAAYRLSQTKITAPVAGYINNLRVYTGEYAKAGQPLFGLVSNSWYIIANYKESSIRHIHPGQKVLIYIAGYGPRFISGRVESIAYAVSREPTKNNPALPYIKPVTDWIRYPYRFPVRIKLDPLDVNIRLHMGTDARTIILI